MSEITIYVPDDSDRAVLYESAKVLGYKCVGYNNPKLDHETKYIYKCEKCNKTVTEWLTWDFREQCESMKKNCNHMHCLGKMCPHCKTQYSNTELIPKHSLKRNNMVVISKENKDVYIPQGCKVSGWMRNSRKPFQKCT
jgi:hypothetical protein